MVTVHTSLDQLPKVLRNFGDQIPFATAMALNETAFDGMRMEKAELDSKLDLKNTWTQRGIRVEKANKRDLTATVGQLRWYVESLVEGGQRRAKLGIVYQGQRYLLVPSQEMKTATGKLKKIKNKNPFVFRKDDQLFLAYRKGKRRLPLQVVGRLVTETEYQSRTFPRHELWAGFIHQHWERNWRKAMIRAARTAK